MRFLLKATIPVEAGNNLVRDPEFGKRFEDIMADLKPEATYFAVANGQRTMYLIVNMDDLAQFPALVEPLWLSLKCDVDVTPVMTSADMDKAMASLSEVVKKY